MSNELHDKIMNLPSKRKHLDFDNAHDRVLYSEGHRDARHAAAELALGYVPAPVASAAPSGGQSIGAYKPFEQAAKALHHDWSPMKVHRLIKVADEFVAAAIAHQPPKEALTDEQIIDLTRVASTENFYDAGAFKSSSFTPRAIISFARAIIAASAPNKQLVAPSADDVEWIVNDMGELGVRIAGRCFFCYKGESLVYESGLHDDDQPILHRNVGKREFGETVWPMKWVEAGRREHRYTLELVYTPGLSFGSADNPKHKWLPLPVEVQS